MLNYILNADPLLIGCGAIILVFGGVCVALRRWENNLPPAERERLRQEVRDQPNAF